MNKLQKTARGLDTFFQFFFWVCMVGTVISSIAIAVMWVLYLQDPDILELFHTDLNFGMIQFTLADSVKPANYFELRYLALGSIVSIAEVVVFCMFFHAIRGILAPLKEGRPFHDDIVRHLKKLGWLTVASGILTNLGTLIIAGNLLPGYDLEALFLSDKITQVSSSYSFNLNFVLHAVLLFLLSWIFEYGGELQQLSDETL